MRIFLAVAASWLTILSSAPAFGQGTWTQIMNVGGTADENSAEYFVGSSGNYCGACSPSGYYVTESGGQSTSTYSYFSLPTVSGGAPDTQWSIDNISPCNSSSGYPTGYWTGSTSNQSRAPGEWLHSYYGPSSGVYKGLGFFGSFNGDSSLYYNPGGGDIVEGVFFHENPCYAGEREYGIYYDAYIHGIAFYGSAYTNCTSAVCNGHTAAVDVWTFCSNNCGSYLGTNLYWEIWPIPISTAPYCQLTIQVQAGPPSYTILWGPYELTPWNATSADSSFCSQIENEHGYVTAATHYSPTTGLSSSHVSNFFMSTSDIFVGR